MYNIICECALPDFITIINNSITLHIHNVAHLGNVYVKEIMVFVVVTCGDPGDILHGTKSGNSFVYKETVTYTCDLGYQHSGGDLSRTCMENGSFNGTSPICSSMILY